jgi:NADP-dependent 3-hydroxy acid dehydrogenase YdfG
MLHYLIGSPFPEEEYDMSRTWFVTGPSHGMGIQIVEAVPDAGDRVVAMARHPDAIRAPLSERSERLLPLRFDLTDRYEASGLSSRRRCDSGASSGDALPRSLRDV